LTPFFLAGLVMLVLLCVFPEIATFLTYTMKQ